MLRQNIDWGMTDFDWNPWEVIAFENQFQCRQHQSRFRLCSENAWSPKTLIKAGIWEENAKKCLSGLF